MGVRNFRRVFPHSLQFFFSIEHLGRFKKKQSEMMTTARKDTAMAAKHVVDAIPRKGMNDESGWKLEILEGRKLLRREGEEKPGPKS